jgi:hypothetical protein
MRTGLDEMNKTRIEVEKEIPLYYNLDFEC